MRSVQRLVCFISIGAAFFLTSCAARRAPLATTTSTSTTVSTATCSTPLTAVLSRLGSGDAKVGENVYFRLEASGCSGQYTFSQQGSVFSQGTPFFYSRSYSSAQSVSETVQIQDANFPTQITTSIVQFNVVSVASGSLSCNATISPSSAVLNSSGKAPVSVAVSVSGLSSAKISALRQVSGSGYTLSSSTPVPSAAGSNLGLSIDLLGQGQYVFAIDVQDPSNSASAATCNASVQVSSAAVLAFADYPIANFGDAVTSSSPVTKSLVLQNPSTTSLSIQNIELTGASEFVQIGGTCASGLLVSAGSSCTISVKFTPQMSGGLRSASLAVTYGGSSVENPTAVLSLQGTGSSASSICLSLSAPSTGLNFGTVTPGSLSAPQAVTLTNQGPGVAKLIGMDLSNSVFKIASDNCPWVSGPNGSQTLASGSSCTINYVFNPSAAGSYNAIATFAYQDMAGASYNSSLSLSGVASGPVQRTLSSGDSASCAVKNGAVLCWGLNNKGILGDGSSIRSRSVPSPVSGLDAGVISVAAGVNHACALRNGGVVCWGANDDGSLGDGSTNSSLVPVSVSGMSSGVTAIAAGGNTTCAIQNGALKCWGYNGSGQLGIGSSAASGANSYRAVPTQVNGLTSGVTAVSLSNDNNANKPVNHVCAIHNGAVKCWGSNLYSSVGDFGTADRLLPFAVPGFSSGIQNVVALNNRTCVVKDGALSCWGYGKNGEIGNGVSSTRNPTPVVPSGMDTGVTAVGGSVSTTCAIKAGRLYCWGDNKQGTVGDGSNKDRSVPTPVTSMDSNVEQVGREDAKSVCATKQGQLYCWGYNNKGQLGDGSTNDRAIPGLVYGW